MWTRRLVLSLAAAGVLAGCSLDSITFLGGSSDAGGDGAADSSFDTPSGPLAIMVSATTLSVPEGETRPLAVSLTQPPPGALLVTLESSDDTRIGISPTAVLFSSSDWSSPQTVMVSGKQDADTSNESGTITLRSTGVMDPVVVNATVADDDGLSLVASTSALDVSEGGTGTIAVHLSAQPATDVVVSVTSANTMIATTSQTMLTFTPANYAIDQTITITGMQDADTVNGMTMIEFASALLTTASIAIQVTDDDVLGIATSASSLSTTEGDSATFTVQLTQQPPANTTVTISSGSAAIATVSPTTLSFTTANYNVPQTVTVTAVDDDDVADNTTMISLASTGLATRAVALSVDDDDTQAIIAAPATTLSVPEGGTAQLALSLAFRPSGSETIAVSSLDPMSATVAPSSVTFSPSNYAVPQMVTVTGVQDADAAPDLTTVRAESTALGVSKDITVNVSEDDTLAIEASTSSLVITEGNTATLMVRLTAQPTANTTVTLTTGNAAVATTTPSSLAFTTANWNVYQPVTVRAVQDLDLVTSSTTLTLAATGIPSVVVAVDSTDDDTQAIVASTTTVNVTEGTSTTVGVTLAFIPTGSVDVAVASMNTAAASVTPATLTFTAANYNVPQNITITGTQDADAVNATTMVSLTSTGLTPVALMVNVTDDDALNIDITPTTLTIAEGATGTLNVRLTAMPAATTTVTIASSDTGAATVAPATLTFTTTNYATYQSVTVTGVEDADAANESVTVTASATGLTMKTATVTVTDNDPLLIVTSTSSVSLGEAGSTTFTVHLSAQPGASTTVSIASSDTGAATVSPATLTFTTANYATNQTVTVNGVQDPDVGDESVTLTLSGTGLTSKTVSATVTDDDMQAIQVSPATVTVNENASTNVNVTLAYQPSGSVTVNVASNATGTATVTPATLTFTSANYATPQAITITGVKDADAVASSTSVSLTLAGATSANVAVTVADLDVLGIQLNPATLSVVEGSTGTLQVRLTAQPQASTTVNLASSDTGAATVGTSTLTFTTANWSTYQNVTITGVQDADAINETVTVTATSTGLTTKTATVSVTDDEVQAIAASPTTVSLTEGGTASFNVHLTAMPASSVTVTLNNPDPGAITLSASTLTFTTANYATDQVVTVTGVQDVDVGNESVSISLTATGFSTVNVVANVTDNDPQSFVLSPTTMTISEGSTGTINVSLAFQPVSNVVVTVSSTNTAVAGVSVTSLTFTPANYATAQPVTVTPVTDSDYNYNTAQIKFTATGVPQGLVNLTVREPGIIDTIDNPSPSFCIFDGTSVRVRLLGNPINSLTLNISTTTRVSATPTQLTFTSSNYNTYQYVDILGNSAGSATMTVSGTGLTSRTAGFSVLAMTAPVCQF